MRKMIWCGAVLVVVGAAGIFAAARHAVENPKSFLGRSAQVAYFVAVRCSPLGVAGQPGPAEQGRAPGGIPVAGAGLPLPPPEIPNDEQQEAPPAAEADSPELSEIIVVGGAEEADQASPTSQEKTSDTSDFAVADPDKDLEKLPNLMPYADEPDDGLDELGVQADCACVSAFFNWLLNGVPSGTRYASCEPTLLEQVIEYCLGRFENGDSDSGESKPPADPQPLDAAEMQDNGSRNPVLPTFREGPNYHQQYPGCPAAGRCPYPYQDQPPKVAPTEPKKDTRPQDQSRNKQTPRFLRPQATGATLDTMECRPTDLPDMSYDEDF